MSDIKLNDLIPSGLRIDEEMTAHLAEVASRLFGDRFEAEGLILEESAKGFPQFLIDGESILLANKMKLFNDGCLAQMLKSQEALYYVCLTNQRVILTTPKFLSSAHSEKIREYPFDQIASIHQHKKYWVLTTMNKKTVPLFESSWVSGKGATNFLRAMFAFFYERSDTVIIPPEYQGKGGLTEALRWGDVTVIITPRPVAS